MTFALVGFYFPDRCACDIRTGSVVPLLIEVIVTSVLVVLYLAERSACDIRTGCTVPR